MRLYIYLLITGLMTLLSTADLLAQNQKPSPEIVKKYHAFDFWLGELDVYKNGTETLVGHSRIETIIDSAALLENYSVVKGPYKGKSLNQYNRATGQWEQFWVDNSGLVLHLKGGYANGKMMMENEVKQENGTLRNRITWHDNDDGTVRQVWETSKDEGESWQVAFDGLYKPKE